MKHLLLLGCVLLVGCQSPSWMVERVKIGMSEKEVRGKLGKPASRIENPDGSVTMNYVLAENWAASLTAPYSVRLVDGKVASVQRDGPGQQNRTIVTPVVVPH